MSFRTDAADGPVKFITVRWNVPRIHDSLEQLEEYLDQLRESCDA